MIYAALALSGLANVTLAAALRWQMHRTGYAYDTLVRMTVLTSDRSPVEQVAALRQLPLADGPPPPPSLPPDPAVEEALKAATGRFPLGM